MCVRYKFRYYTIWATFTDMFGHCLCVTMCNFIMYHTKIGICHKLNHIATKNATKQMPNVRAHCVAEPDANQHRKIFEKARHKPSVKQKRLVGARLKRYCHKMLGVSYFILGGGGATIIEITLI